MVAWENVVGALQISGSIEAVLETVEGEVLFLEKDDLDGVIEATAQGKDTVVMFGREYRIRDLYSYEGYVGE